METAEKYPEVARLSCEQFEQLHPYPFLVMDAALSLERAAFSFVTHATPAPSEQDEEEERLRSTAPLLAPVRKRESNPFRDRISIGRTAQSDITIPDSRVSKFHAYFDCSRGAVYGLADVSSRNGTRINGHVILPEELAPVGFGDLIEIGPFPLRFASAREVYEKLQMHVAYTARQHSASMRAAR